MSGLDDEQPLFGSFGSIGEVGTSTQDCPRTVQVASYIAGTLADRIAAEFSEHVLDCPQCQTAVAAILESDQTPEWLTRMRSNREQCESQWERRLQCVDDEQSAALNAGANESQMPFRDSPRFRVIRRLGAGGMGVVWLAWDEVLHRNVAIKQIQIHGKKPQTVHRMMREAAIQGRLSHPNIVALHEILMDEFVPTLVMEYVEGASLSQLLRGGVAHQRAAAKLIRQLALALQYAHDKTVFHRDLKPSNVLVCFSGEVDAAHVDLERCTVKLADFGLAQLADELESTQSFQAMGTPAFMAPEQTETANLRVGPETDVYGLGAILYTVLTGRPPHLGHDALSTLDQVRSEEPIAPRNLRSDLDKDLETICLKCLRKSPEDRYRTAQALVDDLQNYLAGKPITARPISHLSIAYRWCVRNRIAAASLAIASLSLLLLIIGAAVATGQQYKLRVAAVDAMREAMTAEQKAVEQAVRAEAESQRLSEQFEVAITAADNLFNIAADISQTQRIEPDLLVSRIREQAVIVHGSFLNSLPVPEQWTTEQIKAVVMLLYCNQKVREPFASEGWLGRLETALATNQDWREDQLSRQINIGYFRIKATAALNQGEIDDAVSWFNRIDELHEQDLRENPSDPKLHCHRSHHLMNVAMECGRLGSFQQALQLALRSVVHAKKMLELGVDSEADLMMVAEKLAGLAVVSANVGEAERIEPLYQEVLPLCEKIPVTSMHRSRAESVLQHFANLRKPAQ